MLITEIVYLMYITNHNGWAMSLPFATRAPLKVTSCWWTLQRNHYALLERIIGNSCSSAEANHQD